MYIYTSPLFYCANLFNLCPIYMNSISVYFEYLFCFVVALTHKTLAFCLIVAVNIPDVKDIQDVLQIVILLITGFASFLRARKDWKTRNKRK